MQKEFTGIALGDVEWRNTVWLAGWTALPEIVVVIDEKIEEAFQRERCCFLEDVIVGK